MLAALARNPALRARRRSLGIAEAEAAAAGLLENPELEADIRKVSGVGTAIEAALPILIPRPGERAAREASGQAGLDEARALLEAAERDLVAEVRSAHAGWAAAREAARLAAAARESADRLADWTRGRAERGAAPRHDALLASSDAAAAARDLADAAVAADAARDEVARLLGLAPGTVLEPAPRAGAAPAAPPEGDALLRGAVERRPEVRAARARLDRAEQELRVARLGRWPWPVVGPSYERDADGERGVGITVGISLPIFDSGAARVRAREAARDAAREEYDDAVHSVRAEAARTAAAMRAAVAALKIEEEGVAAPLEEALRLAGDGYTAGNLGLAELLATRDRWSRARASVVERRLAVELAAAALERAAALEPAALRRSGPPGTRRAPGGSPTPGKKPEEESR